MKYLFLLLVFIPFSINGQEYSITGNIVDAKNNDPLEFTAVSLLKLPDSSLVSGITANMKGAFELKATPGEYLLRFDFMGFETLFSSIKLENSNLNLGTISLKEDGEFLEEITITAARQLF